MQPYKFFIGDIVSFESLDTASLVFARIESVCIMHTGKVTYEVEGHAVRNLPEEDLVLVLRSNEASRVGLC